MLQLLWTTDVQTALEQCKVKKTIMKDCNTKQLQVGGPDNARTTLMS